jgi:GWxTD domain-containing protein
MSFRVPLAVCAVALTAITAFAANLGKYKDWPNTPEGYFMTASDRAAWKHLKSEDEADEFIKKFVASRGPGFEENVAAAAKAADEHLTIGSHKGSQTLRGKIVILLGPPQDFQITQHRATPHYNARPKGVTGTGVTGGNDELSADEFADAGMDSGMAAKYVRDYAFTYAKDKLPTKPAKDVVITIEVNTSTGEDRITDSRMSRQVNELLDAAAESRAKAQ